MVTLSLCGGGISSRRINTAILKEFIVKEKLDETKEFLESELLCNTLESSRLIEFIEGKCDKMHPKVMQSYLIDLTNLLKDKGIFNQVYKDLYDRLIIPYITTKKIKGNC